VFRAAGAVQPLPIKPMVGVFRLVEFAGEFARFAQVDVAHIHPQVFRAGQQMANLLAVLGLVAVVTGFQQGFHQGNVGVGIAHRPVFSHAQNLTGVIQPEFLVGRHRKAQSLPISFPRDRGRQNALINIIVNIIVAGIEKDEKEFINAAIGFSTHKFKETLERCMPFELRPHDTNFPRVSPYKFEIHDLIPNRNRGETFSTLNQLVRSLDLEKLSKRLQEAEIIGIDESIVDVRLSQNNFTFLKSIAFRMYPNPDNTLNESFGPIVSHLRTQFGDSDKFENENKLIGYIRNNFIAYVSALSSLKCGRKPFVILHGPLVRAIGGFSHIIYRTAKELMNIDIERAGDFSALDKEFQKAIKGDENLKDFHRFCIDTCQRQCSEYMKGFWDEEAIPEEGSEANKSTIRNRKYPGFCLYFWVLRRLFDLCNNNAQRMTVASVVEDIQSFMLLWDTNHRNERTKRCLHIP